MARTNRTLAFLLILCLLAGHVQVVPSTPRSFRPRIPPLPANGVLRLLGLLPPGSGSIHSGRCRMTDVLNSNNAPLVDALISSATTHCHGAVQSFR